MAGTPLHLITLAICAFLIVAVIRINRPRELAYAAIAAWALMQVWWMSPGRFDPAESLPLHVCDIAAIVGPAGLLGRWRWARTLVVFWGVGLTTQGFITPVVAEGPEHLRFYVFWLNHLLVLTIALHELIRAGYRPRPRDVRLIILLSAAYALAMLALNAATGWNYGFVGPDQPDALPTLLDLLGPWPQRVAWIALLTAAWFTALGCLLAQLPGGERRTT